MLIPAPSAFKHSVKPHSAFPAYPYHKPKYTISLLAFDPDFLQEAGRYRYVAGRITCTRLQLCMVS